VLKNLGDYYGSVAKVSNALLTVEARVKLAADCMALRMERKLDIRTSVSRETDRFTLLQQPALVRHSRASAIDLTQVQRLQLLAINAYWSRTALSEQSRDALVSGAFPFVGEEIFRTTPDMSEHMLFMEPFLLIFFIVRKYAN